MKTTYCVLILMISWVSARATNYTVKPGASIQACASAMSAGDTCTVFAGTYNENVTVPAGTAGNYKTITINPGDTVKINGTVTMASHTKLNGFQINGTGNCVTISSATDVYVTNNKGTTCAGIRETSATYLYITGNTVYYPGSPVPCTAGSTCNSREAIYLNGGDHILISNNDLSHFDDGIVDRASFVIVRHNTQHDSLTSECGSASSNCHIDEIETWGPNTTVVYESNTFYNNGTGNTHLGYFQYTGGQQAITRFNRAYSIYGFGWLDDNQGYSHVKHYNETKVDTGGSNFATDDFYSGSTSGSEFNNIFYYTGANGTLASGFDPYYSDSTATPFTSGCNIAYQSTGSFSWAGPITTDGSQRNVNPLFTNIGINDYSLTSASPARNAGCALTSASGAGSGSTTLVVKDASFFQDGYGLSGVQGDGIRVGSFSNPTVEIASVDYSTDTITLASPISWSNGAPIWLCSLSDGTNVCTETNGPDIGAIPYGGGTVGSGPPPSAPTNLSAVVN